MPLNGRNGRDHEWTHEECIEAGQRWVEAYGEPPSRSDLDPTQARRRIRKARERLQALVERSERFVEGEMPGTWVIGRLFGGMDAYLHAMGFTPRGTGRPPKEVAQVHRVQAQGLLEQLTSGHRWVLDTLDRMGGSVEENEIRYQRSRDGSPTTVVGDLHELEAAGLVESEVRVSYRLTDAGRAARAGGPDAEVGTGVAA